MNEAAATPLAIDVGCRNHMLWRCDVTPSFSACAVERILEAGAKDVGPPGIPALRMFEHPDAGHRIVFVERTARVQLRLDALTPHAKREAAARALYDWLVDALMRGAS